MRNYHNIMQFSIRDSVIMAFLMLIAEVAAPAAPVIELAPAKTVVDTALTTTLRAVVTTDQPVTLAWSKVSGPGAVTFTAPAAARTRATFEKPGDYLLRLTAGAGDQATVKEITVTVSTRSRDAAVLASAVVSAAPPRITLSWPRDIRASGYTIARKAPADGRWGAPLATLPGEATSYTDTAVTVGTAYEYQLEKIYRDGAGVRHAYGYLLSGIELPLVEERGTVILLVDATVAADIATEVERLQADLQGDGWTVIRHDVARTATPPQVRALIQADYQAAPDRINSVFLLGHLPIPRSGWIAPDGHADHRGAWPADQYYGDLDGIWTDTAVTESAPQFKSFNRPADGNFDQTIIPSDLELAVGRVDFCDMPAFAPQTEVDLLRQYLDKNHEYRHRRTTLPLRGHVSDGFASFGYDFAQNGFRNFAALCGADNITAGPGIPTGDYLWLYGCGPGTYTSANGVGNTDVFVKQPPNIAFTMLYGSYHGDWAAPNNFMRAALAAARGGLTCCWAASPNYFFHPMGLGETVGACVRASLNNEVRYLPAESNGGIRGVHAGLLGDPTLRLYPVAPPAEVIAAPQPDARVQLTWKPSPDPVLGYYVYRLAAPGAPGQRITPDLVAGTTWTDTDAPGGTLTYLVRAVALQTTPSGSFRNASQGVTAPCAMPARPYQVRLHLHTGDGAILTNRQQRQVIDAGGAATYLLSVVNTGTRADRVVLSLAGVPEQWSVRAYTAWRNGSDITAALRKKGDWTSPTLQPGEAQQFRLLLTADASLAAGDQCEIQVNALSDKERNGGETVTLVTATALRRPDLFIRPATVDGDEVTPYVGDDQYDSNGTQAAVQSFDPGPKGGATFLLRLVNRGNAAANLRLRGEGRRAGCVAHYFAAWEFGTEITEQVIANGYPVLALAAGAEREFRLEIFGDSDLPAGTRLEFPIAITSDTDPTVLDAVKAVAVVYRHQPGITIRNLGGIPCGSARITNDRTGHTAGQHVAAGQTASYEITIRNNGADRDSFIVTAPRPAIGWTASYYDGNTDKSLNDRITKNGWLLWLLAPGATRTLYLDITPGNAVDLEETFDLKVHLMALSQPNIRDAVTILTTKVAVEGHKE